MRALPAVALMSDIANEGITKSVRRFRELFDLLILSIIDDI